MSVSQLRTLKRNLEELLAWDGKKGARGKLAIATYDLYLAMGKSAVRKEYEQEYSLSDMSTHIFKLAHQENSENEEKWEKAKLKENKTTYKRKTPLFDLSVLHMKNCYSYDIDHNDVPFIMYALVCIRRPYIQSDVCMEGDISLCLSGCASKSQLHWAEHHKVQQLWQVIWSRMQTPGLCSTVMRHYAEVALAIMREVELSVYETSAFDLVKTVIIALRKASENSTKKYWDSSTRKYSYVSILSYVVHRWGIAARDLILQNVFEMLEELTPLISIEKTSCQDESKLCMMLLVDDLAKLAMIERIGDHRTISDKTKNNVINLMKMAVTESSKSAHKVLSYKLAFSMPKEYVEACARWLLVLRELDPPSPNNSFEEPKVSKKLDESFSSLNELIDLSFCHKLSLAQKCNAWDGALQIVEKVLENRKLDGKEVERIIAALWGKRKTLCGDAVRSTFCSLLTVAVCREDVQFGNKKVPSIDAILKHSLSLMPVLTSVPKSALLIECILRHRSREVPKDMLHVIFDTVSRANPSSMAVLRLMSALISYSEFDENSRFCSINNDDNGKWSLRKDIVDWLLQDPGANTHGLIFQLCQYHPIFCFDLEKPICEDTLLLDLQHCHLAKPPVQSLESRVPLEAAIDEMIQYVGDELHSKLDAEFSLPLFVISYEFSSKTQLEVATLDSFIARIPQETKDLDDSEFLESIQHFTAWPEKIALPIQRNSIDCLIAYFLANLHNQQLNLSPWLNKKDEIVDKLAGKARKSAVLQTKLQQSMPFNNFVRKVIMDNLGDFYETMRKFNDYSFLLSHGNLLETIAAVRKDGKEQVETEETIGEADLILFERISSSNCLRNGSEQNLVVGYNLDPMVVAVHPNHVHFTDRSVILYLRKLRNSPFLAQNIVRYILTNGMTWHLHGRVLEYVMKHRKLLSVCIATIPNMVRFLKMYQVLYDSKSETVKFLGLKTDSIAKCRKFMRKPNLHAGSITPDDLMLLFGYSQNKWPKVTARFWKLFEKEPAVVCEKLHRFAEEGVKLGLTNRLAHLLQVISTSEFSRKVLSDRHLRTVFWLTYRSIFSGIVKKECSTEIVELCCDEKLRYDLFEHRIKKIPAPHADAFMRFETEIAFSVEKFLQHGLEADDVNYTDFGLVEFYRQLNENLTEEIIRTNESHDKYLIDFFASMWLLHPAVRPQILQIVARFKHVSPAWTQFPQPPHVVATETTFLWKLRFTIAMNIMNNKKWKEGELSTYTMLLLTTYNKCHYREDIIPEFQLRCLKNETKRDVLCILSKILKKDATNATEEMMDRTVFEAVTHSAHLFPDIAACIVPFLFKLCRDVTMKYDDAFEALMACLKGVDKEDRKVVYCLAECFDSLGLDAISRYEKVRESNNPNYSAHWQLLLARLFVKHGFFNHAFSMANILFDRFGSPMRNLMMIDRVSMENIENSEPLVELLVEIYVAENNSVALSTLPPNVQTRPEVRQVMHKKGKEWLRLVAENVLSKQELTVIRWMCGLQSEDGEQFLDSILRCRFTEYPKIIDSHTKFIYFLLYHLAIDTDVSVAIGEIMSRISEDLTIDQVRLLLLATDTANFEPHSVEEHVVRAIRDLRETTGRRKRSELSYVKELNEKTHRIVQLTGILAENNAYGAASNLLKRWHEECIAWNSVSVDVPLVEICQCDVMCQSGDTRMAEIQLRAMSPRVASMSDMALAEWTLVLSKITLEYRNDLEDGVRLLEKGCKRLQKRESVDARLKVLLKFHSVCINQLSKLEEYRESRSFRMKQEAISVFEQQINNSTRLVRGNSGDEGSKRTVTRVRREHQCEKDDVEKVQNSVTTAAQKAVSSAFDTLDCISQLDDDDEAIRTASLIIFPLIDLIYKYEKCPEVVDLLREHVQTKVTSKFWLCATSHIASKCFSVEPSPLRRYLYQILSRLIFDYPYHVLHTVIMYENGQNASSVRSFLSSIFEQNAQRDKVKLKEIVIAMRDAHSAYRELARMDVKNARFQRVNVNGKQMLRMPSDLKIFKCKLNQLPIPIITQKIGRPGDYTTTGIVTWKSWKGVFTIADGLSAPKIWEIEGSDGKWYKTVWKLDDVRQDVLVEQMFDVTNNMLEKRVLRTYNVVPLDTDCGIIEFCGGTISIKELLCGATRDQGLHQEFNPDEVPASKVSVQMRNCQNESTETRRKVFVEICKAYSPVFRHFFYRNFPTAHIWREKVNEYRRSLATWSVVCYIVGLGDRHASNILFDQKMCTFVHIDLGMILEYSKRTLPVPEQVPFRISRDLLDPILIEGVENGQLAEDCINAIEKLKQNGKVILGVASALLRETMTNFRETEQASGRPSYISEMAIGRLRDKLQGTDDGVAAQSSNFQIRRLLREATSADNLSRMFCGWMPYL